MTKFFSMGIMNYCSHDPACALIKVDDSKIEFIQAEEGFLSRKKKSYQFPIRSMKYCLDYFSIKIDDIDSVTFDYMDHRRDFRTSNNYRLLIGDYIRSKLKIPQNKMFFSSHHYAHALSTFWPSGFDESTVMIVDGLGSEQQTHSIFYMNEDGGKKLEFEQKGVGIGALYSLVTNKLGFDAGEDGKTMGLAPYGKKHFNYDKILPSLKGKFFDLFTDYSQQIHRSPSMKLKLDLKEINDKKDVYNPYFSRLAYNLQKETERCLKYLAIESIKKTGSNNLCFAGGVALNCVANEKIRNNSRIKNFYIYPASGDSGIPVGLALAGLEKNQFKLHKLFKKKVRSRFAIPYSCDSEPLKNYYNEKFEAILKKNKVVKKKLDLTKIADLIAQKKIGAICSKGIELGPRALGHRSFLADASDRKMKEVLNKKIKHRELYRPFAPIVLEKFFKQYFESKTTNHSYMLMAPKCKKITRLETSAICHIDNTARVQTVSKNNGIIFYILKEYMKLKNIPILINTSFNDNNEPIVFTKLDAFITFLRCRPDFIIYDDSYIERKNLKNISEITKSLEALQKKIRDEYFMLAINELTEISSKTKNSNLRNFLKLNLELSKGYKNERMILKLIDFLTLRDKRRMLYLDTYHIELLKKIFSVIGFNIKEICPKVLIINDDYHSDKKIKESSDFILYNFSSIFHNKFWKLYNKRNIQSFYEMQDKLLIFSDHFNTHDNQRSSCLEEISQSYENDYDKTINDFFKKFI